MFKVFLDEWANEPFSYKEQQIICFMLENAFKRLSVMQKKCIAIKYGEKISKQEYIAMRLKVSHQAVSKQLRKAENVLLSEMQNAIKLCKFIQEFSN